MIHERMQREFWQIFRFLIVGGSSFLLTASLYALFTRVLFVNVDRAWMNLLANCICAIYNFLAHQRFTYKAGKIEHGHVAKYLFVLISALSLNGIGFWIGHGLFNIDDRVVFVGMSVLVPFYTYCMHRQFTFRASKKVAEPIICPPIS